MHSFTSSFSNNHGKLFTLAIWSDHVTHAILELKDWELLQTPQRYIERKMSTTFRRLACTTGNPTGFDS